MSRWIISRRIAPSIFFKSTSQEPEANCTRSCLAIRQRLSTITSNSLTAMAAMRLPRLTIYLFLFIVDFEFFINLLNKETWMKGVTHAKTKKILQAFETIAAVPRCSKHEEKICDFLLHWAKENGLPAKKDKVGNIAIQVPASRGYEKSTGVVIQGHVDMVCEKTPDSRHDFVRDAIELVYDKGWLMANKTTLGADNGIALAMALTLALDKEAKHPPLELLFTVDEETGLTGANSIEPGFIRGKILLNVDSEDEGVFTVGCAGGRDTHITLPVEYAPALPGAEACQVKASGMSGGHSGVNIHDERANAIIVLARTLHQIHRRTPLQLLRITGGTAHNAIPRDAEAIFFLAKEQVGAVRQQVSELEKTFQNEFKNTDPNLKLTFSGAGTPSAQPLAAASSARCINLLLALPHGVAAMSTEMKSLVETSNNLANVKIEDGKVAIVTSQRSSVMSKLHALTHKIEIIAGLAGAEARSNVGYPSWQPNLRSALLAQCKKVYKRLFKKEPHVESIHAGLECGIIGDKNPGMDMISFGPTIKNPHSPDERILIASIGKVWDFLVALLASLK